MLEQAKYEFESQESMRAKKTATANKAMKAALRQAKQRQARRDLPSTWTAGMLELRSARSALSSLGGCRQRARVR
jgi:hypothetical protein